MKYEIKRSVFCVFISRKEQVTDITSILRSIQSERQSMRDSIDSQQVQINRLTRSNQRLTQENNNLRQRLSKYEVPPKNSSNSSTPPSKESMKSEVLRRTNSLRQKSEKPSDGQIMAEIPPKEKRAVGTSQAAA